MRARLQWLVFGLLICLSTGAVAQQATLKDVRLWASSDKTRAVFDLGGATEPDLFMIDNPLRLVVDLPDVRSAAQLASDLDGSGLIERVRMGKREGTDLRVVLDLADNVNPKSFMLAPDDEHGYRLVVDLRPTGATATTHIANASGPPQASDNGPKTAQASANAMAQAAPAPNARAATSERVARRPEPPSRDIVIVIDAGHGGKDPGAIGQGGTLEKDVVLQIARRLKRVVDDQPNMRGVLTRDSDTYIGLRQRMVIARKAKADLFLSIHADAAPRGVRATGASVYALSQHGATSEAARWLARRENAADLVGGVSLKGKDASLASFMLDLSQGASIEASLDAGNRVLQQLDGLGPLHKAKIQQAGFMVLKSPDIPSFLVETAFISTPSEERKLRTAGYQQQLAGAMLRGVKGYFASYRPTTFIAEAQIHKVERGETLSGIAQMYGISLSQLRSANDLSSTSIRIGQSLQIPGPGNQQVAGLR